MQAMSQVQSGTIDARSYYLARVRKEPIENALNVFDDQFDMTEALLSIAIAMFGITALIQRKWLLYFSSIISVIGIIFGLAAFFKVSLHNDLVSKILG